MTCPTCFRPPSACRCKSRRSRRLLHRLGILQINLAQIARFRRSVYRSSSRRQASSRAPQGAFGINYAKTDEAKKLIQVGAHDPGTLARPFVLPPGTPKDRVQILRKAFADTMADAEFLAEAKKSNLDISPLSGEDVENIFKIEPTIAAKLKQILLPK
jgi:hypothetical protein